MILTRLKHLLQTKITKVIFLALIFNIILFLMEGKNMANDDKWKDKLNDEEYHVMRCGGTEPPFTGKYYKHNEKGTYNCNACKNPLFSSKVKYESGSGWPSFYDAIDKTNIETREDHSLGMKRTEILCGHCGAHLGHVFEDGPNPTGLRYCVNSISLDFKKEEK